MQHTEDNTENREQNREQHTGATENSTPVQQRTEHRTSTHIYHTYSFDFYHEYVAIKNSDTIELYTILK